MAETAVDFEAEVSATKSEQVAVIPGLGDLPVSNNQVLKGKNQSGDENSHTLPCEDSDDPMRAGDKPDACLPPPAKKRRRSTKRKSDSLGASEAKNPLMQLNEIRPGLTYDITVKDGQTHCPLFFVSVNVDGNTFEGQGSSKQKAKHNAAENVLKSFITQIRSPAHQLVTGTRDVTTDFTSDNTGSLLNIFGNGDQPMEDEVVSENPGEFGVPPKGVTKTPKVQTEAGKHPVSLLNEFHPGLSYEFLGEEGEQNAKQFKFKVTINGQDFLGHGSSKKKGKANVASKALFALYNIRTFYAFGQSEARLQPVYLEPPPSAQLEQVAADLIADAVLAKFQSLQPTAGEPIRRKVLASIVMTSRGESEQKFEVISMGTGTKFISGEYISDQGLAVNDCHGEIIARRSFVRFLYSQLELCAEGYEEESIFEKKKSGFFGVRENVEFHLYINTSPCGDARVFSPHEPIMGESDKHPGRKKRGLLRVKLENGEGTIPAMKADTTIQTWDGVLQGERLRTMSCSDKVCRWNVLGVQGALLSHFLEPIYLQSVVLGSLYHYEHMSRAMYHRLGDLEGLPPLFKQNRPLMNGTSTPEPRVTVKSPNISVNWSEGDQGFEIVNATKGVIGDGQAVSRLCKQSLFKRFIGLWKKLRPGITGPLSYHGAKAAAGPYQAAKMIVMKGFESQGLGTWIRKPVEQDMFELSDEDL